jgi:hypothetical protein
MVLIGPPKSPRGGTPLSLVKSIRIPTHGSHDADGAIWPGKVPLLDHLVSEAVGTNGLGEKLWRARGDLTLTRCESPQRRSRIANGVESSRIRSYHVSCGAVAGICRISGARPSLLC